MENYAEALIPEQTLYERFAGYDRRKLSPAIQKILKDYPSTEFPDIFAIMLEDVFQILSLSEWDLTSYTKVLCASDHVNHITGFFGQPPYRFRDAVTYIWIAHCCQYKGTNVLTPIKESSTMGKNLTHLYLAILSFVFHMGVGYQLFSKKFKMLEDYMVKTYSRNDVIFFWRALNHRRNFQTLMYFLSVTGFSYSGPPEQCAPDTSVAGIPASPAPDDSPDDPILPQRNEEAGGMNFEKKLEDHIRKLISSWDIDLESIYTISFCLTANDSSVYKGIHHFPEFSVGYNTEEGCDFAGPEEEERWDYEFLTQNSIPLIDADNPDMADALLEWYDSQGITDVGTSSKEDAFASRGKGPRGYWELLNLITNIARKLQTEGFVKDLLGRIPIIIHDDKYSWFIRGMTLRANPHGEAVDFIKYLYYMWREETDETFPPYDPEKEEGV